MEKLIPLLKAIIIGLRIDVSNIAVHQSPDTYLYLDQDEKLKDTFGTDTEAAVLYR